jgi:CBS domain containing-hemolysin-like protein
MVLSELVPKSLALHDPLHIGLFTVHPMKWSLWLYSGFINVLNGSGHVLLKMLGQASTGHRHIHSPDELALLLAESGKSGRLAKHEEERLQGALKLSHRPVKHLMTPRLRMRSLPKNTPPESVVGEVMKVPYTRIPILDEEGDSVLGIVFTQDVLKAFLDGAKNPSLDQVMRPVLFVPDQMTADKLYVFLREHAAHIVMVVDEFGSLVGLVTLDDLMAEMLGDMPDEFKQADIGPERLPDGRIRFAGLSRVEEVEPYLDLQWEGEAATVGGMILETLGKMPQPGDKVRIGDAEFEAERVTGHLIGSVLLMPAPVKEMKNG